MKQAIKHSRGRLWLSVGLPIMLLALATALGGVAILADFAGRQDRAFEQGSQQLVASALRGRMRASSNTTKDYAFWNDAYDAITLGADRRWVETNFTSAVADGIVVFRADRTIRHQWFREGAAADADSLAAAIASQAASQQDLRRMASARDVSDMVVGRMLNVGGQLVIASTAPISREGVRASERARGRPADFVASFDILDQAELNEHGGYVGLADLTFNAEAARPEASDVIAMALPNSSATGWLTWRNQRPGSAGLLNQSLPLVALLLLAGLMAVWVTRRSVTRHLELLAHAEAETEASRAKSEFIATMSHELRTPLNAIIGYSELVKEELADLGIDQSCADLDRIEGAGRHLLRLIEDILDHAKAETGKLSIDSEPLNVFRFSARGGDLGRAACAGTEQHAAHLRRRGCQRRLRRPCALAAMLAEFAGQCREIHPWRPDSRGGAASQRERPRGGGDQSFRHRHRH